MENNQKPERYPCSFCWQESKGTKIVPNVRGFDLGGGGHWYACQDHLDEPMLRDRHR